MCFVFNETLDSLSFLQHYDCNTTKLLVASAVTSKHSLSHLTKLFHKLFELLFYILFLLMKVPSKFAFLFIQEITTLPRLKTQPDVEFLPSTSLAQFASDKLLNLNCFFKSNSKMLSTFVIPHFVFVVFQCSISAQFKILTAYQLQKLYLVWLF